MRTCGSGLSGQQHDAARVPGVTGDLVQRRQLTVPSHEQFVRGSGRDHHRCGPAGRGYRRAQHLGPACQHRPLQVGQRIAGVQTELVGRDAGGPAQFGQCVAAPAARPQREGEQPPALLPQGVLPYEGLGRGHRLDRSPGAEGRLDREFPCDDAQFAQPGRLGVGPLLVGPLPVRRPVPPAEGLVEQPPGLRR